MKNVILSLLLCIAGFYASAQKQEIRVVEKIPMLQGDSIAFPITLVNAYPLISAEVNGVKGKFMFDTGSRPAFSLNEGAVKLPDRKEVRKGIAGSGQSFMIHVNDTIASIKFNNGIAYHNLFQIESSNYDFLQRNITPDFLGFIGHDFFTGYIFKLDYLRKKITFYKNTEIRKTSKDFLKNENVLAIISFETRALPNHPLIKVKVGNTDILASFDTGQYGLLQLEDKARKKLTEESLLRSIGLDGNDDELVNIYDVEMGGVFKTTLKGIHPFTLDQTAPFRKAIQITEPNYMSIGYRFFDQYKTVWDYDEKKIYVLER